MHSIETIRLSQRAKDQLITLKRRTGIENWNVLCRWALCASLAEPSKPPKSSIPSDSNVEMTWRTFAGANEEVFLVLLHERCLQDGIDLTPEAMNEQFRLHLHRGISYLVGDRKMKKIEHLVIRAAA